MTLEDLLRIARSQEAVDCQMKMMVPNAGAEQVTVVGVSKLTTRSKICFASDKDGHFSRSKRCPARKCGSMEC